MAFRLPSGLPASAPAVWLTALALPLAISSVQAQEPQQKPSTASKKSLAVSSSTTVNIPAVH